MYICVIVVRAAKTPDWLQEPDVNWWEPQKVADNREGTGWSVVEKEVEVALFVLMC